MVNDSICLDQGVSFVTWWTSLTALLSGYDQTKFHFISIYVFIFFKNVLNFHNPLTNSKYKLKSLNDKYYRCKLVKF